ncbi:protein of unknown function [Chitinophaga jiangningensis]|uniref:DUF4221 domain-containing protein n=1 Tax=Chitinophaga jiangningensis TaxID=1419482 RepID=A0A1M6VMT7_9BACT|nr:DUF4221 family protein [Chitinophaga jiangningensis]SHK82674.1 protein of unknown function [Chitinophaga jiangningensis]
MKKLLIIILLLTSGCDQGKVKPVSNCSTAFEEITLRLTYTDTLQLFLDSQMVFSPFTPIDYDALTGRLYAFDSYNKRLLTYQTGGDDTLLYPAGTLKINTKEKVSYFRYLSPDSLLLYAYNRDYLMYYDLKNEKVTSTRTFLPAGKSFPKTMLPARPFASAAAPIYLLDSVVVGAGYLLGEKADEYFPGRTIFAAIHPGNHVTYHIPYSGVYQENNWGGSHLRIPYTSYNAAAKQWLLSLPADHHMRVIDSNWKVSEVPAASAKGVCITSMALGKDNQVIYNADVTLDYYLHTPTYRNIIHDPYSNCYYRILEMPVNNAKQPGKQPWLIVLDKNFQYKGEAAMPMSFALDNFFIGREGICFLDMENENQNIARYVQCKISW